MNKLFLDMKRGKSVNPPCQQAGATVEKEKLVVNGSQLKGKIPNSDSKYFFGYGGKLTEQEYYDFLVACQPLFKDIKKGNWPDSFSPFRDKNTDAVHVFNAYPVKVARCDDGYTWVNTDGAHRFFVAQKNGLDLLVEVWQ